MADYWGSDSESTFNTSPDWSQDSWDPSVWDQWGALPQNQWGSGGGDGETPAWTNPSYNPQQPGPVPSAWPEQTPQPSSTQDYISDFLNRNEGSRAPAWAESKSAREFPGGDNPNLRNAEHALFTNIFRPLNLNPPVNPLLFGIPMAAYSGAKWLAQNIPGGSIVDRFSPIPLHNASPPSWEEILWGMRPLFGPLK